MSKNPLKRSSDLTPPTSKGGPSDPPRPEAPADEPASREEAIRRAAYAAYERRGGEAGNEKQDWLDAETEVDRRQGKD